MWRYSGSAAWSAGRGLRVADRWGFASRGRSNYGRRSGARNAGRGAPVKVRGRAGVRPVVFSDVGSQNRTSSRHRTGAVFRRAGQHPTGLLMNNPSDAQLYRGFSNRCCWEMSETYVRAQKHAERPHGDRHQLCGAVRCLPLAALGSALDARRGAGAGQRMPHGLPPMD
jgi:hypothetical protein